MFGEREAAIDTDNGPMLAIESHLRACFADIPGGFFIRRSGFGAFVSGIGLGIKWRKSYRAILMENRHGIVQRIVLNGDLAAGKTTRVLWSPIFRQCDKL